MGGNAVCWINTVCYIVCIQNFPSNPRVAIGLSTSYLGLSAMVYTVLADTMFNPLPHEKAKVYLLLNAVVPMVITLMTIPVVRQIKSKNQTQPDGGFILVFTIAIASGICAVFGSIGSISNGPSSRSLMLSLGCLLVALLLVPLATKFREFFERGWCGSGEWTVYHLNVDEVVIRDREVRVDIKVEGGEIAEGGREMSVDKEVGASLMVRKVEFWLYFFGYMFGATVGLVFLNNLGQIVESRGLSGTSSMVSLASSFGFFGRCMISLLDYLLSKNIVSRPALIAILLAPMAGSFSMLLNPSNFFLYISIVILGACTGAITSIAVSATSELFGSKFFGINHNIIVSNIPVGSFIFGYFAALLYQTEETGNARCMGAKCYEKTFIAWGILCSISTLLFVVLYIRTRRNNVVN
uniref:Putative transporter MCH1 n=1 Tax=Anthurium amnicola TaxID=1678845 RepID=A0A1D1Y1D6_9ARAE